MHEFRNTARTGKVRVWMIGVDGDKVITEYGELGGKFQRVVDTAQEKNRGKVNYVSPEEAAIQQMKRQILLKERAGYREIHAGARRTEVRRGDHIDWMNPLPNNLCFYKPDNTLSARLEALVDHGHAWFTRKRDGEMMVIRKKADGKIDIYSRRMLLTHDKEGGTGWQWWHRFAHIADDIEFSEIPPCTILLGEMVAGREEDDRWHVASVMKSLTPRALELQQEKGDLFFYCWDIAFWGGRDLLSVDPVRHRVSMIEHWLEKLHYVLPIEIYNSEVEDMAESLGYQRKKEWYYEDPPDTWDEEKSIRWNAAAALADERGWEGFVVVDPDGVYGDRSYNFRGKADRPGKYSGKLKPEYELDAIMYFDPDGLYGEPAGKWGRGNHQGKVGSVELYQYDAEGQLVHLCDCGGGFDDDFREQYSDPNTFPIVGQIKYTTRTFRADGEKTNALQFPRLLRVRDDKSPDECIEERLTHGTG